MPQIFGQRPRRVIPLSRVFLQTLERDGLQVEWDLGHQLPRQFGLDIQHHNFHTATGRYLPFARLVASDGLRIARNTRAFRLSTLLPYQILVISNALGSTEAGIYSLPAFTPAEVAAVHDFVQQGGALLLIADHAPMGVAAESLAQQLGVNMSKGYTEDPEHCDKTAGDASIIDFSRQAGLLGDHPILRGRNSAEQVNRVLAFTGQSLRGPAGSAALLILGQQAFDHPSPAPEQATMQPDPAVAWRTAVVGLPTRAAAGRSFGVAFTSGRGRVVVLGEAAMLSAQNRGPEKKPLPMGMNVPGTDNKQFTLNVVRWLAGVLR